ncbi:MAG: hypothetical protein ABSA76_01320 [Bacteroidales bacterium]
MKNLLLIVLLCGASLVSGNSDYPVLYVLRVHPIIKTPERAEIQFKLFASHLSLLESSGDWKIINSLGMLGKYQFSVSTLEILGYHNITPEKFKADPSIFSEAMQEQALRDLMQYNERYLKRFASFIGQIINGTLITKAGLLGAAHLAGVGGVQRFLTSAHNATDINGSSVQKYLNEFQNYNV